MESEQKVDEKGMRKYSKKEIEEYVGDYDKDGFYILKNKDFFDSYGYYFNTYGFDLIGGFYQDTTGVYVSPDNYDEDGYQEYYDELCGSESEGDDQNGPEEQKKNKVDEHNIPENVAN